MVGGEPGDVKWQVSERKRSRSYYILRRLSLRTGRLLQWGNNKGIWPEGGRPRYINELELLYHCLRAFAGHASGRNVLMQLDNTKAVAYINKRGGLKSKDLNRFALEIIQWGENKGIDIKAVHLSGSHNFIADQESREHTDASDWNLSPEILKSYQKNGTCPLIYLLLPGILS